MGGVVLMENNKGTVIDSEGHVMYRFDNPHNYEEDLKDGEQIVDINYIDDNPIIIEVVW